MDETHRTPVITGIGLVTSLGNSVDEFWSNCLEGRSRVELIPSAWTEYYESNSKFWSPLTLPDFRSYGISRAEMVSADIAVLNAIVAADDALFAAQITKVVTDAKLGRHQLEGLRPHRLGVFLGTGLGCITSTLSNYVPHLLGKAKDSISECASAEDAPSIFGELDRNLKRNPRVSPFASLKSMPNAISASLSIRYGLTGQCETISLACAAGTSAIARGAAAIRAGALDVVLVGGSEYYGDEAGGVFMAFDRLGALAHGSFDGDRINRPFDEHRSGFLFSQGAACVLVLESIASAETRNVEPIAKIISAASTSDAYSLAAISPEHNSIEAMVRMAVSEAGVHPEDVTYVNAHGTGTQLNDQIEAKLLSEIFGPDIYVNSTKSLLGHTIGASGAIEAAVTALAIRYGQLHVSRNAERPIANLRFPTETVLHSPRFALTQNFGFGGHNCGLVLGRAE